MNNERKYPVMLTGATIAAYADQSTREAYVELRDACRDALAEHDLDAGGNEKPLTVGGKMVMRVPEHNSISIAGWTICTWCGAIIKKM